MAAFAAHDAFVEVLVLQEPEHHPRGNGGIGEIAEQAVNAQLIELDVLANRRGLIVGGEVARLIAERVRMHEQAGLVGALNDLRRPPRR